jgi:hypothetical protein
MHDIIIINDIFCCSFKLVVIEKAFVVAIILEGEEEEGDTKEGVVFSSVVELLFIKEMTSTNRVHL